MELSLLVFTHGRKPARDTRKVVGSSLRECSSSSAGGVFESHSSALFGTGVGVALAKMRIKNSYLLFAKKTCFFVLAGVALSETSLQTNRPVPRASDARTSHREHALHDMTRLFPMLSYCYLYL
jgi:hypothetical protein